VAGRPQIGRAAADLAWLFERLYAHFGPQGWWPAEDPWEVAVGAVLTQAVSWGNVVRAIEGLKERGALAPAALAAAPSEELAQWLRATRFFRQKAARLQALAAAALEAGGLGGLLAGSLEEARGRLLAIPGIGPETADDILLYAGHRPTMVVDRYTHRILVRMGWYPEASYRYEALRSWLTDRLPAEVGRLQELHALLVALGKQYCLATRPRCGGCPLAARCRGRRRRSAEAEGGRRRHPTR
jgi:endonuclease-3 related protein